MSALSMWSKRLGRGGSTSWENALKVGPVTLLNPQCVHDPASCAPDMLCLPWMTLYLHETDLLQ